MELIVILVILLVIFGASKLGEIGGAIGKSVREFRRELKADDTTSAAKGQEKPEDKQS